MNEEAMATLGRSEAEKKNSLEGSVHSSMK